MRKLVTLRQVTEILPIEGADFIELALLDGWQCVVKKGEFQVGAIGVYFEIDSFLDHTKPQFAFLAPRAIKWNGKEGARIKSMKLKGNLSQGLLLPLSAWPDVYDDDGKPMEQGLEGAVVDMMGVDQYTLDEANDQLDLTTAFGVDKWEKLLPANLSGTARGNFPSYIRKTDQERVQNLPRLYDKYGDDEFQVSQKLDGSSMTGYIVGPDSRYHEPVNAREGGDVFIDPDVDRSTIYGVCSRNLDLVDTEGNAFWEAAKAYGVHLRAEAIAAYLETPAIAIQGELIGQGIQQNHEKVEGPNEFHVYDIFDIERQRYVHPLIVAEMCEKFGLTHVPIIHESIKLSDYAKDRAEILQKAVGPSIRQKIGEGKVFKLLSDTDDFSFKAISDVYLLKTDN